MAKNYQQKVCPVCGQTFTPTSGRQILCEDCRQTKKMPSEKQCKACGRSFVAYTDLQQYCDRCRIERNRQITRESLRRRNGSTAAFVSEWEKIVAEGKLICRYCGKRYHGEPGSSCCPECAAITPSNIRQRICRECGREFPGGPRAWYCPECRAERQKAQDREANARRKAGTTRKIGSEDICTVCGKPYTVTSGTQLYCPDCAKEAIAAVARQRGRQYGKEHNDERRQRRKAAKAEILCAICRRPFIPKGGELTCSRECSAALQKAESAEAEKRNREQRNAYHRQRIADKVSAMTPEEYAEYRAKINAKAREAYAKRKEKKDGNNN